MNWSEQEIESLCEAWNAGQSATEIADATGRTRNMVISKIGHLRSKGRDLRVKSIITINQRTPNPTGAPKRNAFKKPGQSRLENGPAFDPLPGTTPIPLMDIQNGQCRWPIGEPFEGYCGQEVEHGSYCPAHNNIAWKER